MSRDPGRPDPDALLAAVQRETSTPDRGRLKIFFGFAPGVGKTYAMLQAAHRLRNDGVDVAVGIVETHGRAETMQLVDGLEVLSRLEVAYRGRTLREFDLEAAIARRPSLLLVDELAHTNAPGLRHEKRWQDIFDVLASGIDVHTTLNVQHVEGLVDLVEQTTGLRIQETVPDTVLDRADEIELIDLPPDELLTRLREGKIYLPDVADRAVDRFFRRTNLLSLRELALVRMARRVGADAEEIRRGTAGRTAGLTERILVGVGPGVGSRRAIRDAARIAAGLRAEWIAVTVHGPSFTAPGYSEAESLESNLKLAESIGARIERLAGTSVADAILEEARRIEATRIVVGRTGRRQRWWPFRENVLERLVRDSGSIDVVVAGMPDAADAAPATPQPPLEPIEIKLRIAALVGAAVAVVVGVGWSLRPWVDDHDVSLLSLLLVVVASLRFGRGAGIFAVVLAALGIDLFFLHPTFELAVADTKEIGSLVFLLSVGIVVAELIVRMESQRERSLTAERRVTRLLELSRRLASATTADDVAAALAAVAADVTGAGVEVVLANAMGEVRVAASRGDVAHFASESGVMLWCHTFGEPAGRGMTTLPGSTVSCLPIRASGRSQGVLIIGFDTPRDLGRDEHDLLRSATQQAAARLAMLAAAV